MRSLILMLGVVAACSGTEDGATFTVVAPEGPGSASRIEIVLANADEMAITTVEDQRVRPGGLLHEKARYYRQRATGGIVEQVQRVDGFVVRIEPNLDDVDEERFIPFMLAYDASDTLIAVGAVRDEAGEPSAVDIRKGQRAEYVMTMTPLAVADPALGLADGQGVTISCPGTGGEWRSGIAWQPGGAAQLRLLLPDTSTAPKTDATLRAADLDCDVHAADVDDCDDLHALYHPGSTDVCDGEDTNCDGERIIVQTCVPEADACAPGVTDGIQLCQDTGGGMRLGMCVGSPACQCASGNPGPCTKCILAFEAAAATAVPCAPSVGKLHFPGCSDQTQCTIDVVPHAGQPWEGFVAATPDGAFATRLTNVTNEVYLKTKFTGANLAAAPGASVGAIYLAITAGGQTRYVGVDLELSNGAIADCADDSGPAPNTFNMACSP